MSSFRERRREGRVVIATGLKIIRAIQKECGLKSSEIVKGFARIHVNEGEYRTAWLLSATAKCLEDEGL